jgi:simple sugar transport system ATP-binding protein
MADPLLSLRGITKRFGVVTALDEAAFDVYAGEVVALIGDNGAGKSTLLKIITGVLTPDSGEIRVDGRRVAIPSPTSAHELGIEAVYQDLALAPDLNGAANLYLGRELIQSGLRGRLGVLDKRRMEDDSVETFAELGVAIRDSTSAVATMSGGQRQGVAVARSVAWAKRVLLMDEPTAALGAVQTRRVLELIRRVRDRGVAVVLVSHNMLDVLAVSDRVEVLRLGARVGQFSASEVGVAELVTAMTAGVAR